MSTLADEVMARARRLRVPLSVHLDVTYRCNERCVHCYLERHDCEEMDTDELRQALRDMARAGVFFLLLSGGEPFLRPDLCDIVDYARALAFNIQLKTNATLIGPGEARRLRSAGVHEVQVSIYSHRPEAHDAITRVPGSFGRSLAAIRIMRSLGQRVAIVHVVTRRNAEDSAGVKALAREWGAGFLMDLTIAPQMDGNPGTLPWNVPLRELRRLLRDPSNGRSESCGAASENGDALDQVPCNAGHAHCYVAPDGSVFPCVRLPLPCGSLRQSRFVDIWLNSRPLEELRAIRKRDLGTCSQCALVAHCRRCQGLAFQAGDLRGPSPLDCRRQYAATGRCPAARKQAFR